VDEFAAQAAFDPASVCGQVEATDFHEGDNEGNDEGEKGIHAGLLAKKDFPPYGRGVGLNCIL
jgi:hypothetical protein